MQSASAQRLGRHALPFVLAVFALLGASAPVAAQTSTGSVDTVANGEAAEVPDSAATPLSEQGPAGWLRLPFASAPPKPTRPLDLDSLRVKTAETSQAVLAQCARALAQAARHFANGQPREGARPAAGLAQRLALFPWRFGTHPSRVEGWGELVAAAREALADIEAEPSRMVLPPSRDDSAQLFLVQLLQLVGRDEEADERLARVESSHWCGTCSDGENLVNPATSLGTGRGARRSRHRDPPAGREHAWFLPLGPDVG